tara:strand:+ start:1312 stop:2283 length:972 start_codon:yes stop_codon:yes gene_type:complete
MAVVRPLFYDNGNIKQMSDSQIDDLKTYCIYRYSVAPAIQLTVTSANNGNLGTINDTRLQAGAYSTSATAFPSEATTAEPSVVTIGYSRINQTVSTLYATLGVDGGNRYPCYLDENNNIRAMNAQDMKDTLIHPAFDTLFSSNTTLNQAGTYFVTAHATPQTGSNRSIVVSNTAIFEDTRANPAAYSAGSIPETLDQPQTTEGYYLQKNEYESDPLTSMTQPLKIDDFNNIQEYPTTTFQDMIDNFMGYTAVNSTDGYTLRYSIGTTGGAGTNTKGSGIADTRLNGSGNYQTRFVNADDYRAQEFPNGTATTISTYYLRIVKA